MDDIKAIAILSEQIQTLRTAPEPPKTIDDGENYSDRIQRMLEEVTTEVKRVAAYVEQVEKKLQELVNSQLVLVKKNQDALQTLFADFQFNTIVSGNVVKGGKPSAVDKLQLTHEIEKASRAIMNDRLNELVKGTEVVLAKLKDGAELYKEDMENLKGCLKDWKNSKAYEKRKQKQERREMEKREKEEQKKQKEEERRKRF
ncbi:merozoite surface protein 9-like [Mercenaria mercenaria]|uniref:merozoite surface protein 9-like n=1 Tax=Mercenaria mercenaria TaxID=6596 RepID=UPI00234E6BA0|nr:merozoite surface protein 9-like [Mercenaria mercenaria]